MLQKCESSLNIGYKSNILTHFNYQPTKKKRHLSPSPSTSTANFLRES